MDRTLWSWDVGLFLLLTFGITWSLAGAAIGFPEWFAATFGEMSSTSPMFYVAVWAPNIAGLVVVALRRGTAGLADLFARLIRVRAPLWVWLAAILFYPALMLVVQGIGAAFGKPMPPLGDWTAAFGGMFLLSTFLLGPLGEELGWRGYLLPRLLERRSALTAGLIVGAIWMVWHLPAFFLSGLPQAEMVLPVFMLSGVALAVFITWIFVNARGSILIAGAIPHMLANAVPGDMDWIHAAVLVGAAVLLVLAAGPSLRGRRHGRDEPAAYLA